MMQKCLQEEPLQEVQKGAARPGGSDLKLALVLIQGGDKLVQGQELAKWVEA